jgi:hypothetical protein
MRYNPQVNYIFGKLFGSKENKKGLKSFMNIFLPPDEQLADFVSIDLLFQVPKITKEVIKNAKEEDIWDKVPSFYITGTDEKGRLYNFQVQLSDEKEYDRFTLAE